MTMTTLDEAIQQLEASGDYRVLRRVPPIERWSLPEPTGEVVRAAILDTETTGLDPDVDEVIELGMLPFDYDRATGCVTAVHVGQAIGAFREPSIPITAESTRVHGITAEMVAGNAIAAEQVHAAIDGAQIVICHHAGFDRPMVEKHWPEFDGINFGCSVSDIDWRAEGLGSSKLDYLLFRAGYFFDGHRALHDATALLFLLTLPLPVSGKPTLSALLERARRPLHLVSAIDTDIDQRGVLKERGYRWQPEPAPKAWVIATNDFRAEVAWLKSCAAWTPDSRVALRAVPASLRYSRRVVETKGAGS
jgi:DNA polymerase-3 subunit epsilon